MKIITNPSVYLIGKQVVAWDEMKRFLADVGAPEWTTEGTVPGEILTEIAARGCYQSWHGGRPHDKHILHLLEVGHGSCIEHSVFTLLITGVSRSLTHELVRHRAGISPSQLSQRYVDESVAEYVCPDIIWNDPELREIWLESVKQSHEAYKRLSDKLADKVAQLITCPDCDGKGGHTKPGEYGGSSWRQCSTCKLERKIPMVTGKTEQRKTARQAARSVLPNATETKITITANARALRHAIESRCSRHAEPEIRKLFGIIWEMLSKESPHLFGDYRKVPLPDGSYELQTDFRKV